MTSHKVIESTSATLLKLVSGATTKPSLTLAQCIQQHICGAGRNQTTLGLAVKLHHKHGSSELIKTLSEHGITGTYIQQSVAFPQVSGQVRVGQPFRLP